MATITTRQTICDRCGAVIAPREDRLHIKRCIVSAGLIGSMPGTSEIDLCPLCYLKFMDFMREEGRNVE